MQLPRNLLVNLPEITHLQQDYTIPQHRLMPQYRVVTTFVSLLTITKTIQLEKNEKDINHSGPVTANSYNHYSMAEL